MHLLPVHLPPCFIALPFIKVFGHGQSVHEMELRQLLAAGTQSEQFLIFHLRHTSQRIVHGIIDYMPSVTFHMIIECGGFSRIRRTGKFSKLFAKFRTALQFLSPLRLHSIEDGHDLLISRNNDVHIALQTASFLPACTSSRSKPHSVCSNMYSD